MAQPTTPRPPKASLDSLPTPLLHRICQHFIHPRTLRSLALTNRTLHTSILPLYHRELATQTLPHHNNCVALHVAIANRHTASVRGMLAAFPEVVNLGPFPGSSGKTFLHLACESGDVEMVRLVLGAGATVREAEYGGNAVMRTVVTAVGRKVDEGNLNEEGRWEDVLRALVEAIPPERTRDVLNWRDGQGRTPLDVACANGLAGVVKILLNAGAKTATWDRSGETPLHMAVKADAQARNPRVVEYLLQHISGYSSSSSSGGGGGGGGGGGNRRRKRKRNPNLNPNRNLNYDTESILINLRNFANLTPLHAAYFHAHLPALKLLLSHPATDTSPDPKIPFHPLLAACQVGLTDLVREGITSAWISGGKWGVRKLLGLKDERDACKTALRYAAEAGSVGCVRALLDEGADVKCVDESGYTPLHGACLGAGGLEEYEDESAIGGDVGFYGEVVRILVGAGADVNARSYYGVSPLHCVAKGEPGGKGEARIAEVIGELLQAGADINAKDEDGLTPLECAPEGSIAKKMLASRDPSNVDLSQFKR